jgi:transcriptional regulator with XRE-family HTH domain
LDRKRITLRDLAEKVESTYEHMRKLVRGTAQPSKAMLKEICRALDLNFEDMRQLVEEDRMQRKYGDAVYKMVGKDPRIGELESAGLGQLTDEQVKVVANMVQTFARGNRKSHAE